MTAATGRSTLQSIATTSDRLAVVDGCLAIDGHAARALLARFGSPLYVAVEDTLRANYRRLAAAFGGCWPAPVTVMYAIKANSALAIRALMSQEGAGGDCFGLGELRASLDGGTDPARMVMNGSDKSSAEIAAAVDAVIIVNVDAVDEIDRIEARAAATGRRARVNLRLKVLPPALDAYSGQFFKSAESMQAAVRRAKWGFTEAAALPLVARMSMSPHLDFLGYSCHVGRFSAQPDAFALVARAVGEAAVRLHAATGAWPRMLDLGGGWPRQREPESRSPAPNPHPIEAYAGATTEALAEALASGTAAGLPLPELWLEPGRYLVGNGVLLLATVGTIKRDAGFAWAHVDACTNHLMRIDTSQAWHAILPASRMDAPYVEAMQVVGGTCIPSVLGADRMMPALRAGDALAILDAGMYADAIANQFNGVPRPATVLVCATGADVIRRRETLDDLFARDAIPARLQSHPKRSADADPQ